MKTSVILPTFNEKGNIVELINKINKYAKKVTESYEVIVVDDNSPDKTGYFCKSFFKSNNHVRVFIKLTNRGLASSIMYGVKKAKGDTLIIMDTDFSHDPKLIPLFLKKIRNYDIVIGSRYSKFGGGENKLRYFLSKVFNVYLKYALKIDITDFLFGYFCVRKDFLVENSLVNDYVFRGFGDYFIRLAYFIEKHNGRVIEIPAYYKNRVHGKSKSNLIKMLITYSWASIVLNFKIFPK